MSNDNITVIPAEKLSNEDVATVKKSFWKKNIVTPIKNHPKLATAIAAGVLLVVGAAFLGRDDSETTFADDLTTETPLEDDESIELVDLTVI
jgi:hypothetical protein